VSAYRDLTIEMLADDLIAAESEREVYRAFLSVALTAYTRTSARLAYAVRELERVRSGQRRLTR
jgi:hypothetical protein